LSRTTLIRSNDSNWSKFWTLQRYIKERIWELEGKVTGQELGYITEHVFDKIYQWTWHGNWSRNYTLQI
jgi:hypothetical protein